MANNASAWRKKGREDGTREVQVKRDRFPLGQSGERPWEGVLDPVQGCFCSGA